MTIPKKEDLMAKNRDGEDELMPIRRELETLSNLSKEIIGLDVDEAFEIEFIPVTKGEINELVNEAQRQEDELDDNEETTEVEKEFIMEKVTKPELEEDMKLWDVGDFDIACLTCIMAESQSIDQNEFRETLMEAAQKEALNQVDEEGSFQGDTEQEED